MSSAPQKRSDVFQASPKQFCKIEKIFVYASSFQLRNKVLDQLERGKPCKLGKGFDPNLDDRLTYSLQEVRRWYVQHGVPVVYSSVQNPFVFRSDWDNSHKEINYYQEIFPFNSTQRVVIVYKGQWLERGPVNVIRLHTEGPYATD